MTEPVSLDQARNQLNFDAAFVSDNDYVAGLIIAARRKVELDTRRTFGGETPTLTDDDAALAAQAILLIVGTWYANREAVPTDARSSAELPLSVSWIVQSLRKWDDGE